MSVGVIGAGAFGTALAISLSGRGPVDLWARAPAQVEAMRQARRNDARLPGVDLPATIHVSDDLGHVTRNDILLMAVPMQKLHHFALAHRDLLAGRTLVACCKGIDLQSGLGPVAVLADAVPGASFALLTGPSFAADIARGLPTALTLACKDAQTGKAVQRALTTRTLRIYTTTDTIGAEVGGALKNVMAIACGAAIGANLGDSARAALMTRGYAEMQRMAMALGARSETMAGLSGFGDLALTCTSELSRNFQLGLSIGRSQPFDPDVTVEGAATARAVATKAQTMTLDMPITEGVVALLDRTATLDQVMTQLLTRPLKEE